MEIHSIGHAFLFGAREGAGDGTTEGSVTAPQTVPETVPQRGQAPLGVGA